MTNATTTKNAAKDQKPVTPWVDFDTDRELVSFERCEQAGHAPTIQGWVIGEERIKEESEDMPAFDCLVMILTAPCQLVNKDGAKYDVPVKTTVLVPKLVRLGSIAEMGANANEVYEMRITPTEKVKLTGIKKMQKFKCQLNPIPGLRKEIAPATMARFNLPAASAAAPALPAAQ